MATKKTTTKKVAKPATPKARKVKAKPAKKLSQIDAAIRILAETKEPIGCKQIVEVMQAKGYWMSPNGKTPSQTLCASILVYIRKGKDARFVKADRGAFGLKK